MFELILTACLLAQPAKCDTFPLPFQAASSSMLSCMVQGQIQAMQWVEQHPGWRIARWSCGLPQT